jgi:hypothetical protein
VLIRSRIGADSDLEPTETADRFDSRQNGARSNAQAEALRDFFDHGLPLVQPCTAIDEKQHEKKRAYNEDEDRDSHRQLHCWNVFTLTLPTDEWRSQ